MIKSNGEQLTGQAFVQGFSSQYSHRSNSAWSWCLVMIRESTLPFFCMEHLDFEFEKELDVLSKGLPPKVRGTVVLRLCQKSHIYYSICQTGTE
jgi:hypothetical protein